MKHFIDVTSSWRLGQNTGMHYDARDFAELTQPLDVRPISWNKEKNYYTELGRTDFGFLTRSFAALRCGCPSGMARRGPGH